MKRTTLILSSLFIGLFAFSQEKPVADTLAKKETKAEAAAPSMAKPIKPEDTAIVPTRWSASAALTLCSVRWIGENFYP